MFPTEESSCLYLNIAAIIIAREGKSHNETESQRD